MECKLMLNEVKVEETDHRIGSSLHNFISTPSKQSTD